MSRSCPSLQHLCLQVLYNTDCNDPRYLRILNNLDTFYTNLLTEAFPEEFFPQHTFVLQWFCNYFGLLE